MRIGYACLQKGVVSENYKTCRLKNASEERLLELIGHNLNVLEDMLDYNFLNEIYLFRISSDIIPFGSSLSSGLDYETIFEDKFMVLRNKIKKYKLRVSMHPGQYTVINSRDGKVVEKSILDLNYHTRLLKALGGDKTSKLVLHIGGVYGDKKEAIKRFIKVYEKLDKDIKERLVIENDDKSYNIEDVLYISSQLEIPVVFDNLHHKINRPKGVLSDYDYIRLAGKTWKSNDGNQKIHYSQQNQDKRQGSHSKSIGLDEFKSYYEANLVGREDIDIMLEVKDKNLSALKINNFLFRDNIKYLEKEWGKYKYNVLEHSQRHYEEIRSLLKDKNTYKPIDFYNLIDRAMDMEISLGSGLNTVEHVWGYFKNLVDEDERKKYISYLTSYKSGTCSLKKIKSLLESFAKKYDEKYLLQGYYFYL